MSVPLSVFIEHSQHSFECLLIYLVRHVFDSLVGPCEGQRGRNMDSIFTRFANRAEDIHWVHSTFRYRAARGKWKNKLSGDEENKHLVSESEDKMLCQSF